MVARNDSEHVTHPWYVAQQGARVGAAAAVPGLIVGAFAGTLRTSTPVLFSLASGMQWFAIGSTFWTLRSSMLDHVGLQNWWNQTRGTPLLPGLDTDPSKSDKIRASTISGGLTGAILGIVFRGPRNVIPGTIMFSIFGFAGQHAYNWLDRRNTQAVQKPVELKEDGKEPENWVQRIAKSKWSPMSALTDEEYEKMMGERILSVEAEIALIDDRIAAFRKKQQESETSRVVQTTENHEKK